MDTLKAIDFNSNVLVCVGDYTGSVDCFLIRSHDPSTPETLFKTLPNANSKINCVEIIAANTRSPRFLVSFGSSVIRGFNKKGKQFFGLELNNLTEPIKHLKLRWPSEVMVAGQFIFNHYVISTDDANSKSSSVQNRNCYISSGKINCLQTLDEKINHKSVSILACEDRLIRVILDSTCEFEIETLGICNVITRIPDYNQFLAKSKPPPSSSKSQTKVFYFCYGTSNGRLSLLRIDFGKSPIEAEHLWEVNLEQSKSAVQCITPTISLATCQNPETSGTFSSFEASEFCVGRADGSIEMFGFENYISEDGNEIVNLDKVPKLLYEYNCKERLTSIAVCKGGQLIICCTFTGCIFSFSREQSYARSAAPVPDRRESVDEFFEKDTGMRIEELGLECTLLEERLNKERERYLKWTSEDNKKSFFKDDNQMPLSALPYMAINDSFVLQDSKSDLIQFLFFEFKANTLQTFQMHLICLQSNAKHRSTVYCFKAKSS